MRSPNKFFNNFSLSKVCVNLILSFIWHIFQIILFSQHTFQIWILCWDWRNSWIYIGDQSAQHNIHHNIGLYNFKIFKNMMVGIIYKYDQVFEFSRVKIISNSAFVVNCIWFWKSTSYGNKTYYPICLKHEIIK